MLSGPVDAHASTHSMAVTYNVLLAGIKVASAELSVIMQDGAYKADLTARPAGIGVLATDVEGFAESQGKRARGSLDPVQYSFSTINADKDYAIDMSIRGDNVTALEANPDLAQEDKRVPVTREHRRGIIDPLSALIIPFSGASPFQEKDCQRDIPVFDGWIRYNLVLEGGSTRPVMQPAYNGLVAVCQVRWQPLAGHNPDGENVNRLRDATDIEVWMAPFSGPGVFLPYRIEIPTRYGSVLIVASRMDASDAYEDNTKRAASLAAR